MAATKESLDKVKRMAGVIVAAGAVAVAGILGSGAVANAAGPVTKVGSDPVSPVSPGGKKAPFTKVGSDPVTSVISGIADAATSGGSGAGIPPLVSPWPGRPRDDIRTAHCTENAHEQKGAGSPRRNSLSLWRHELRHRRLW